MVDGQQAQEANDRRLRESQPEDPIVVPEALDDLHPLVAQTKSSLEREEMDESGLLTSKGRGVLSVAVAPSSVTRALLIMNSLIKALESRDMKTTVTGLAAPPASDPGKYETQSPREGLNSRKSVTVISVLGEALQISLQEKLARRDYEGAHERRIGRPWYPSTGFDYYPTGHLSLIIRNVEGIRHTWSDTDKKRLEDLLNSFIKGLMKAAVHVRTCRMQREKEEREREERRKKIEEHRRLRQEETERLKVLEDQVSNWDKSQRIRQFIEAAREAALKKNGSIEPGSELDQWIAWVKKQADRFDPLVESPPSIPDEPEPRWW